MDIEVHSTIRSGISECIFKGRALKWWMASHL